jgi:imidazole glycerol-phosphate synthase subunit HisH
MRTAITVGIVDYGSGNVRSVLNAFESVGARAQVISQPDDADACTHLVLPGVGAFGFCAERLRHSGLLPAIERSALIERKPLLGICVGMQLMADVSEELGRHAGLGWVGGTVTALPRDADRRIRVPHVGWDNILFTQALGLFSEGESIDFYFDHSFALQNPPLGTEVAICSYGRSFSAVVRRSNILAVQFHPEKSQTAGRRLIESFLALRPDA